MAATDLLIDGYNLLHAAGYGRITYAPGDLQRARQRLLKKLFQLLTPLEISQTAVVFDAKEPPPGLPKNWYIHGLRVMYAQPYGDADEMLEQLIDEHSAPRRLTIVSSDHRLHRAAKARRATAIDSDQFLEHLERRNPKLDVVELPDPAPTSPKATGESTDVELRYWLSLFGDVKISELGERKGSNFEPHSQLHPQKRVNESLAPQRPSEKLRGPKGIAPPASEPSSPTRSTEHPRRSHSPHPTKPGKSGAKSPASLGNKSPLEKADKRPPNLDLMPDADEASTTRPALFSQAWIDELQAWVDANQRTN